MTLTAGTRLGVFEILEPLGSGGMGEVYRARDTKLHRDVAIKVVLESVASNADRLLRFRREAQVLASLNHPNIAQIHGVEDADGTSALVMELVEGPTLADRIRQGALDIDEALPIAKQIADALEVAHERGIVHRDLKPANIKVRSDGTVKVLDFGLAKALDPATGVNTDAAISPTISLHATQAGIILGTAAYMSPEQARGKVVDRRADIWAFGCVLFEMLTGRRAFSGEDVTETIVAVVSKDPDWQKLPAAAANVRPLLERCLNKNPKQRLQAIGDARIEIEELISGATSEGSRHATAPTRTWSRQLALGALATLVTGGIIGALVMWTLTDSSTQPSARPSRFQILPPPAQALVQQILDRDVVISPDGQYIAYRGGGNVPQLFVRPIDRLEGRRLASIARSGPLFFSPDSQWIGFFDTRSLRKIPITGGPAITICEIDGQPRGATWDEDDNIVFTTTDVTVGLLRVPASGGEPVVLTTPDRAKGESNHWHPSMLPNSRGVLFSIAAPNQGDQAQIAVLDFKTGQHKTLIHGGSQAEYVDTGYLLYAAAGTLRAVRFDLERLEVVSSPVMVIDDVWMAANGAARYSVSRSGTLVYAPRSGAQMPRSVVWVDRKGNETPIGVPARLYTHLRLSPDGTRVVVAARDEESDLWIWDFGRPTLRRLTFGPADDFSPVWTPDGQRVLFGSRRDNDYAVFAQAADGTGAAVQLTSSRNQQTPAFLTLDEKRLVGVEINPKTRGDIVWLPFNAGAKAAAFDPRSPSDVEPVVKTPFVEFNPEISPNGRYMAYESEESGRSEIYVRPFPLVDGGRWQVSTAGGTQPAWSRSGRELFYLDSTNAFIGTPVNTFETTFTSSNPIKIFDWRHAQASTVFRTYDVSPDGQRFLMLKENQPTDANVGQTGIVVVLNWLEELKAKLPPRE